MQPKLAPYLTTETFLLLLAPDRGPACPLTAAFAAERLPLRSVATAEAAAQRLFDPESHAPLVLLVHAQPLAEESAALLQRIRADKSLKYLFVILLGDEGTALEKLPGVMRMPYPAGETGCRDFAKLLKRLLPL